MATVWLGGIDVEAEWTGVAVASIPDLLDAAETKVGAVTVPQLAGALPSGPVIVPPRTFTIGFWGSAGSLTAARQLIRDMRSQLGTGYIPVRSADRSDVFIYARCTGGRARGDIPQMVSPSGDFELVFEAHSPYLRDLSVGWYYLDGTARAIPGGNGVTSYVLEIWGTAAAGVNTPVFTLMDPKGDTIRTSTFNVNYADDAKFLRVYSDPELMAIYESASGTVTQNDALLSAGLFPAQLDFASYGSAYLGHSLLAKFTATGGSPRGRILFPKPWR